MALRNAFADVATDDVAKELSALIRRLNKILESNATVDGQNRQRIVVDAITGSLTLSTVSTVTNMGTFALENHRMFQDMSRTAYNTGIRSKLV